MGLSDDIHKLIYRIASEIANQAQSEAPYRTGNLRNDIQVFDDRLKIAGEARVGNTKLAPYAPYVQNGTGVHGPRKERIYPKKAKALKTPYGPRKSIAGMKPNPYYTRAFEKYTTGPKLDRAMATTGKDIGETIKNDLKKALTGNPTIKIL